MTEAGAAVAVIGMSGRFPCARDIHALRDLLRMGADCVRPLSAARRKIMDIAPAADFPETAYLDDIDAFDRELFGYSREEAEALDPEQRLLLEHSFLALADATIVPESLAGQRVGIYIGSTTPSGFAERVQSDKVYGLTGVMSALAAGRISYWLDVTGPAQVVNTACSSSLVAVADAVAALRAGTIELAIVGAFRVHCGHHRSDGIADPLGIHAADLRSRSFDASASGVGIGEGGAVVVLKRMADAVRDGDPVHAEILGHACNHDGRSTNGMTAPNVRAQTDMYRQAWRDAGISAGEIGYFEAHGTGTLLGDPIEYRGLLKAIEAEDAGARGALIGSIKSNLGHLDCAAGIVGMVKCILALEHAETHPTVHFTTVNPHLGYRSDMLAIATDHRSWTAGRRRIAAVSSFGLSGTNAHVVIGERPAPVGAARSERGDDYRILRISARSADQLRGDADDLGALLDRDGDAALDAILWSQNTGRKTWPVSATAGGFTAAELAADLRLRVAGATAGPVAPAGAVLLLANDAPGGWGPGDWLRKQHAVVALLGTLDRIPDSGASLVVLQQYCAALLWRAKGVTFDAIVASGAGVLTRRVLEATLPLDMALSEAGTLDAEAAIVDPGKLASVLQRFAEQGRYLVLSTHDGTALAAAAAEFAETVQAIEVDHIVGSGGWEALHRHIRLGLAIDWPRASVRSNRVRLPVPALQQERCWPPAREAMVATTGAVQLGAPVWTPLPAAASPGRPTGGVLLLRAAPGETVLDAQLLADRLGPVTIVDHGAALAQSAPSAWTADLTDAGQVDQLLVQFAAAGLKLIVLDALVASSGEDSDYRASRILVGIIQAFGRVRQPLPRLIVVTSGCSGPDGPASDPAQALVRGFVKVAVEENPRLEALHLDVSPPRDPADQRDSCSAIADLAGDAAWPMASVVRRNGRNYGRGFLQVAADESAESPVRRGGTYLVTGGAGGVGLTLAWDLVERYDARVAIVSRNAAATQAAARALGDAALGLAGDVCSRSDMIGVREAIEQRWGPVHGVIHAAGLAGGELLRTRDFGDIRAVLDPKVRGARTIIETFDHPGLDFIALMSSLSSEMPALAQADYCAANIFLDELAGQARRSGVPATSIAWSRWMGTGMAAAPHAIVIGVPGGFGPAEGAAACWRALATQLPMVAASERPVAVMKAEARSLPDKAAAAAAPVDRGALALELLARAAAALGLEEVAEADDLFDLGASSLDLIDLFEFVDERFPGRLSVQELLDSPTVGALLDRICLAEDAADEGGDVIILELE